MNSSAQPDEELQAVVDAHAVITLGCHGPPLSLAASCIARDRQVSVSRTWKTRRFARLRHDPRLAFLVESRTPCGELQADHLRREEGILSDNALTEQVAGAFEQEDSPYRAVGEDRPVHTRPHYETGRTALQIIVGGRILPWDNAKSFPVERT